MNVPIFPYDALPGLFYSVLRERSNHEKDDAIGASILEAISSLLASGIAVGERPEGGTMPLASYGVVLGSSGVGKSFHQRPLAAPIETWVASFKENYDKEVSVFKSDLLIWKKHIKLLEKAISDGIKNGDDISSARRLLIQTNADEPKAPVRQKLLHDDAQIQSVLRSFEHWPISAWMSDEGGTILPKLRESDFHVLANLWEGKLIPHERVGEPDRMLKGNLAMLLMIQPERFSQYMRKHGKAWNSSGFSARVLYYPILDEWLGAEDPDYAYEGKAYQEYVSRVTNLLVQIQSRIRKKDEELEIVALSDQAKKVFSKIRDYYRDLAFSPRFEYCREFLAKFPGHVSRMAIKNHVFLGKSGSVSVELLERAEEVCRYHLDAFKWVNDPVIEQPQRVRDAMLFIDWMRRKRISDFPWTKMEKVAMAAGLSKARLRVALTVMFETQQAELVQKDGEDYIEIRLAYPNLNSVLDKGGKALY